MHGPLFFRGCLDDNLGSNDSFVNTYGELPEHAKVVMQLVVPMDGSHMKLDNHTHNVARHVMTYFRGDKYVTVVHKEEFYHHHANPPSKTVTDTFEEHHSIGQAIQFHFDVVNFFEKHYQGD